MRQSVTIGIAGAGGDGVIIAGSFLQRLSALQGYYSQMPRYYGAQIRGGGSAVKLSLDADAASFPRDSLDVLVCFDWERYLEVKHELALTPETLVFYEQEPAARIELPRDSFHLDFSCASRSVSGSTRGKNVVALAVLIGIIGLRGDLVKKAIEEDEELIILKHNLPPAADATPRVILSGNSAMAQAALRAGSKAFFGYPITPASEIMKEIYQGLIYDDGVFLQAED